MNFRVEKIDPSGARASTMKGVKAGISATEFPQRVVTSTDINYAERAMRIDESLRITTTSEINEIVRNYTEQGLSDLLTKGKYEKEMKIINSYASKEPNKIRMLYASIGQRVPISDAVNTRLLRLQKNLDVLAIHDSYDLSPANLEKRIKTSIKLAEDEGMENVKNVIVRMPLIQRRDILREKIMLAQTYTDGTAMRYASPTKALPWYLVLKEFSEADKWMHVSAVPKTWGGNHTTSMMHMLQFFGIDSFALATRKVTHKLPQIIPKRFVAKGLGYLPPAQHSHRYGENMMCETNCPVDKGMTLSEYTNRYNYEERGVMNRVHEMYDSQFELALDRDAIYRGGDSLLRRYASHEFATKALKAIHGIDVNQSRLHI